MSNRAPWQPPTPWFVAVDVCLSYQTTIIAFHASQRDLAALFSTFYYVYACDSSHNLTIKFAILGLCILHLCSWFVFSMLLLQPGESEVGLGWGWLVASFMWTPPAGKNTCGWQDKTISQKPYGVSVTIGKPYAASLLLIPDRAGHLHSQTCAPKIVPSIYSSGHSVLLTKVKAISMSCACSRPLVTADGLNLQLNKLVRLQSPLVAACQSH